MEYRVCTPLAGGSSGSLLQSLTVAKLHAWPVLGRRGSYTCWMCRLLAKTACINYHMDLRNPWEHSYSVKPRVDHCRLEAAVWAERVLHFSASISLEIFSVVVLWRPTKRSKEMLPTKSCKVPFYYYKPTYSRSGRCKPILISCRIFSWYHRRNIFSGNISVGSRFFLLLYTVSGHRCHYAMSAHHRDL